MRITYRLTLDMLLPVPTQAVLYESLDSTLILVEYNRALKRLGSALSVSMPQGYPQAVLSDCRTLAVSTHLSN